MSTRGWRPLDHTADLALAVHAESEAGVLAEAARALVSIMTEGAAPAPEAAWTERRLAFEALDPEDRLVRWLNEVIYLATSEGFLVRRAEIELHGTALAARVLGCAGRIATELKSVTYHDLHLGPDGDRWRARIVVDV